MGCKRAERADVIEARWQPALARFMTIRAKYLLYD